MFRSLVNDGLREDDGSGGAVAGDVIGLVAASLRSWRPCSQRMVELDSRATVTPVGVTVGEPNFLSSATFRLRPSVVFTAWPSFDAGLEASACFFIKAAALP